MKLTYSKKLRLTGWLFILPSVLLVFVMSFYTISQAFLTSFQSGTGSRMTYAGLKNYARILVDPTLRTAIGNTLIYMIQIPIMLGLALMFAQVIGSRFLKCSAFFRTMLFLPCAMASVSYSLVFRILFATDGFINSLLNALGAASVNFFGNAGSARAVIMTALVWRWTGYKMVFLSAAMQNVDASIYEAASIDGANGFQRYFRVTLPLLRPTLLLLTIMTVSGTIQLFDESVNLTGGGPANGTLSISHYIYNLAFKYSPNFGYATAISFVVFAAIALLTLLQMKVGDKRE